MDGIAEARGKPGYFNTVLQDQPMNPDLIRIEPYGQTTQDWMNQHNYQLHKMRLQHIKRKDGGTSTLVPETSTRKGSEVTGIKTRLIVNRKALQLAEDGNMSLPHAKNNFMFNNNNNSNKGNNDPATMINAPRMNNLVYTSSDNSINNPASSNSNPIGNNKNTNNLSANLTNNNNVSNMMMVGNYSNIRKNSEGKSLNKVARSRTLQKIASENQDILYRIQSKRSEYSVVKLLKASQEQEKFLANVSRFKRSAQNNLPMRVESAKPAARNSEEYRARSYSRPQNNNNTSRTNWNKTNLSLTQEKDQFNYLNNNNNSSRKINNYVKNTNNSSDNPRMFRTFQNTHFSTYAQNYISSINRMARQGGYFSAQEQQQQQQQQQQQYINERNRGQQSGQYDQEETEPTENGQQQDRESDFNARVQLFRKQKNIGKKLCWIEVSQGETGYYVVVLTEAEKKTFRLALNDEQAETVFEQIDFDFDRLGEILAFQNGIMVLNLLKESEDRGGKQGKSKDEEFVKVDEVLREYSSKSQQGSRENQMTGGNDENGEVIAEEENHIEEYEVEEEDNEQSQEKEEGSGDDNDEDKENYSDEEYEQEENTESEIVDEEEEEGVIKSEENEKGYNSDLDIAGQDEHAKHLTAKIEKTEMEREKNAKEERRKEEEKRRLRVQQQIKGKGKDQRKEEYQEGSGRKGQIVEKKEEKINDGSKKEGEDYEEDEDQDAQNEVENESLQQNEYLEGQDKLQSEDYNDEPDGDSQEEGQETHSQGQGQGQNEEEEDDDDDDDEEKQSEQEQGEQQQGNQEKEEGYEKEGQSQEGQEDQDEDEEEEQSEEGDDEKDSEGYSEDKEDNHESNKQNTENNNQSEDQDDTTPVQFQRKSEQLTYGEDYNEDDIDGLEQSELRSNQKQKLHQIDENHDDDGSISSPQQINSSLNFQSKLDNNA